LKLWLDKNGRKRRKELYLRNKFWRLAHPKERYIGKARYYRKHRMGKINSRVKWTGPDIKIIMEHKIPDVALSKLLGRSVQAIQIKRNEVKYEGIK
jgi:hypothetical protein